MKSFEKEYSKGRLILKDVLPLQLPLCISIEASNLCNFKCIMCPQCSEHYAKVSKPLKHMEMNIFNKCVLDIKNWCEGG